MELKFPGDVKNGFEVGPFTQFSYLGHLKVERSFQGFCTSNDNNKKPQKINLCLLFGKNMLNYPPPPFFFKHTKASIKGCAKLAGTRSASCSLGDGGLAAPLKEMKLLNTHASGALKDCFFLPLFAKQKSHKEELFEVLWHLHFAETVAGLFTASSVAALSAQELARQKYFSFFISLHFSDCLFWLQ